MNSKSVIKQGSPLKFKNNNPLSIQRNPYVMNQHWIESVQVNERELTYLRKVFFAKLVRPELHRAVTFLDVWDAEEYTEDDAYDLIRIGQILETNSKDSWEIYPHSFKLTFQRLSQMADPPNPSEIAEHFLRWHKKDKPLDSFEIWWLQQHDSRRHGLHRDRAKTELNKMKEDVERINKHGDMVFQMFTSAMIIVIIYYILYIGAHLAFH